MFFNTHFDKGFSVDGNEERSEGQQKLNLALVANVSVLKLGPATPGVDDFAASRVNHVGVWNTLQNILKTSSNYTN